MRFAVFAALLVLAGPAAAQQARPSAAEAPQPSRASRDNLTVLAGEWILDLRPSLEDAAFDRPLTLEIDGEGNVSGTFDGERIVEGLGGYGQGRACVAFRTAGSGGPSQTSACLLDGRLVGQTWSQRRGFVLPWTARRP